MAVVLTSAVRQNPSPCQHFLATITADGTRTVQVIVTMDDVLGPIGDDEIRALVKLWARYHTGRGKTLGSLVGQQIFAEIP